MFNDINQKSLSRKFIDAQLTLRALVLHQLLRHASFDPNQPRISAGNPDGGQWTDGRDFGPLQGKPPLNDSSRSSRESGVHAYEVSTKCAEHLATLCKGSVMREFPTQYLDVEIEDVRRDAASGIAAARKALKLRFDKRFRK